MGIEYPVNQLCHFQKSQHTFELLYKTWLEKRVGYKWQQKILFQQLLYEIFCELNNPYQNYANIHRIEKSLNYINHHYYEKISLSYLCSLVKLSSGYFSKIFKTVTGKTPIQYINQVRIEHSKDLLANTLIQIKDIAQQVGFSDEFYFTRVFKQHEGYNPSVFRNKSMKNKTY